MNIGDMVISKIEAEQDLALDFSSFLLRYHRDLNYEDFSDDKLVLALIKRAEMFRNWADVEDLANGFETLQGNFETHRQTTSQAFQEMLEHIDKKTREVNEKTNATIDDIMNTAKDIEQLNEDLRQI